MITVLGKYELRAVIASGSRSTVYEGWDTTISRRVAVKKMPLSQAVQVEGWQDLVHFRREAQAAARLQHSNVVGIFDYGESDDFACIVMEFVEGGTLESALAKGVRFPISVIGRLMGGILAGLEYCHQRGVVHRDIKPSNIMVSQDGHAKITDFGLARLDDSNLTQIGTIMGTPAFMSPEQFMGEVTDWRTDIYSAGVLLYLLLTGELPFDGGLATIMHKALHADPPKPSQLSATVDPSVNAVVARAMAKRPDHRFQSAKEFADTLLARLAGPRGSRDRQKLVDRLSAALARRSPRAASQLVFIGGAILIGVAGVTAATVYRPWILHRVAGSNGEAHSRSPPPAAETFSSPGASGGPRSEQPRASHSAPTTGNVPAGPEANVPTEPADLTRELVPNQLASVPPQGPQPSQLPSVPPQEPQPSSPPPAIVTFTTPAIAPLASPPAAEPTPRAEKPDKREEHADPEILIPAFVNAAGRDSLGRGLDHASIAVAVAKDRAVQQEREALPHYLSGAYRDPYAAKARLDEMVKRQGRTSTAARIAQDPTQLGELRGRVWFFAGTGARTERAMAERAAAAIAPSLERIGAAEIRAAQAYRESVEAQRKADATPVPKLSEQAEAAVASLAVAANEKTRAELWIGIMADKAIGAELRRFSHAVQRRFGDDTVRAMLRSEGRPVEVASVPRQHGAAMAAVGRITHTLKQGEWASARQAEAARLDQRQALGYRQGLKQ